MIILEETNKYTPYVSITVCKLYTVVCVLRALWLVVARDRKEWRHGKLVFFVLFNVARGFEIILDLASETLEKSLAGAIYK